MGPVAKAVAAMVRLTAAPRLGGTGGAFPKFGNWTFVCRHSLYW